MEHWNRGLEKQNIPCSHAQDKEHPECAVQWQWHILHTRREGFSNSLSQTLSTSELLLVSCISWEERLGCDWSAVSADVRAVRWLVSWCESWALIGQRPLPGVWRSMSMTYCGGKNWVLPTLPPHCPHTSYAASPLLGRRGGWAGPHGKKDSHKIDLCTDLLSGQVRGLILTSLPLARNPCQGHL